MTTKLLCLVLGFSCMLCGYCFRLDSFFPVKDSKKIGVSVTGIASKPMERDRQILSRVNIRIRSLIHNVRSSQWIATLILLFMAAWFIKDYLQFAPSEIFQEWPSLKGSISWIGKEDLVPYEAEYYRGLLHRPDVSISTKRIMLDWLGQVESKKGITGYEVDLFAKKSTLKRSGLRREGGARYIVESESSFSIRLSRSDIGPVRLDFSGSWELQATSISIEQKARDAFPQSLTVNGSIDAPFTLIIQGSIVRPYYSPSPSDEIFEGKFGEELVEYGPHNIEYIDPSIERIRRLIGSEEVSSWEAEDIRDLAGTLTKVKNLKPEHHQLLQKLKRANVTFSIGMSPGDIQVVVPVLALSSTVHEFGNLLINGKMKNVQGGTINYAFSFEEPGLLVIDGKNSRLRLTGKAVEIQSKPEGLRLERKIENWTWYWQALFWFIVGFLLSVLVKV